MKLFSLIAAVIAANVLVLQADRAEAEMKGLVVVELYTSQGCSSCPPADELLQKLAQRTDVLPLALHVDYWDYIGWADSFARPEHTARQKAYAHVAGSRTIYTPQMVIGGVEQIVGTRPMDVADAVMQYLDAGQQVRLSAERNGETVEVRAPQPSEPGAFVLQLVRFVDNQTVKIERGENAGRTLEYSNIVTDWDVVGEWSGGEPLSLTLDVTGPDEAAFIVQKRGPGRIVGALRLP